MVRKNNAKRITNSRSRAVHYIIIRGIERTVIFQDDEDHESFLDRLGDILIVSSILC